MDIRLKERWTLPEMMEIVDLIIENVNTPKASSPRQFMSMEIRDKKF